MKHLKVCHITTVHPRYDVRIFHKECKSLSNEGYNVSLIVADNIGDESVDGVNIYDVGKSGNRVKRMFYTRKKAFKKAKDINADIYHLHDPELLSIAKKLKNIGKKVIYDAHEDVPRQILNKHYIPSFLRTLVSKIFEKYENSICKKIDGVVAATSFIKNRFLELNINAVDINNFPLLSEIKYNASRPYNNGSFGYIGGIFETRGIFEMLNCIADTDLTLHLAGGFVPASLENRCRSHKGWQNVVYHGVIGREDISGFFEKISAGFVVLSNTPSYYVSMPVKMFEYMAAGVPVIASNFPLWRKIIEENNCGVCVDPNNIEDIKNTALSLIEKPEKCKEFGENARLAVENKYNWKIEEKKMLSFYKSII